MAKLQVGAIGLGFLGRLQSRICSELDDVELVAGADVVTDARVAFETEFDAPAYDSYEELLDEHSDQLDAVFVVSPHTLHYDQVMACIEHGLHVHLEKPMVTDIGHALEIIDAVDERDLIIQLGYQRHVHPAYREIKRLIDEERIGEIHMMSAYLGQRWITEWEDTWRTDPDLSGGGQLYDSGSHLLDAILWTADAEPRSVTATMDYRDAAVDVNSALAVTLSGPDRPITASIGISGDGQGFSPEEGLYVWGTDGRIAYEKPTLTVVEAAGQTYETEIAANLSFETLTRKKLEAFIDALHGEREVVATAEFGLQVTALTEAAYEADETGRTVNVHSLIKRAREKRA